MQTRDGQLASIQEGNPTVFSLDEL